MEHKTVFRRKSIELGMKKKLVLCIIIIIYELFVGIVVGGGVLSAMSSHRSPNGATTKNQSKFLRSVGWREKERNDSRLSFPSIDGVVDDDLCVGFSQPNLTHSCMFESNVLIDTYANYMYENRSFNAIFSHFQINYHCFNSFKPIFFCLFDFLSSGWLKLLFFKFLICQFRLKREKKLHRKYTKKTWIRWRFHFTAFIEY